MATRFNIIFEDPKTKKAFITYGHFDGYVAGAGETLFEHHNSEEAAFALIKLGYISVLAPDIGIQHDFDDSSIKTCKFYGRDRGDKNTSASIYDTLEDAKYNAEQQYVYVWTDGKWMVNGRVLGDVIAEMNAENN